nr:immunoglobulin heavy chain junction region [Macaca mulatta]MOW45680.1 immunoglobulin heavy chain junction region [Macaca mulatta]MOW45792.1 immunoglobulin heavy chain junction region [Macaca mulatta]MOW45894.1 immunoglobulin heavy chain junction region [Macaca mulatta]MOW45927.1 immunoglobulin heavy chain junction region [Macaca mulatta]
CASGHSSAWSAKTGSFDVW